MWRERRGQHLGQFASSCRGCEKEEEEGSASPRVPASSVHASFEYYVFWHKKRTRRVFTIVWQGVPAFCGDEFIVTRGYSKTCLRAEHTFKCQLPRYTLRISRSKRRCADEFSFLCPIMLFVHRDAKKMQKKHSSIGKKKHPPGGNSWGNWYPGGKLTFPDGAVFFWRNQTTPGVNKRINARKLKR